MSGSERPATEERPRSRVELGIVVAKRHLSGVWQSHAWLPVSALPDRPMVAPWTKLASDETQDLFYAGPFTLELHPSETGHYRDNLRSGRPSLWIALRPIGGDEHEITTVTADPYEGESLAEGINEIVEAVAMPREIERWIAAFVAAYHVERGFLKRKRDRADPEALAMRPKREDGSKP